MYNFSTHRTTCRSHRARHLLRRACCHGRFAALSALTLALALTASLAPRIANAQAESSTKLTLNQIQASQWPEVTLNLTLTGADGKAVPGVQPEQFEIIEGGQSQAVSGLKIGPARNVPLFVVLATDISGSMNTDDKLSQAKAAASTFIASLGPADATSLVAFNDRVQVALPSTTNRAALQEGLNALQAGGNTAIYDALYGSAQLAEAAPVGMRRVIILLTDGVDTASRFSSSVAEDVARQSSSLVYTIGLGPDTNDKVLTSLSAPGGGKYYKAPSAADLTNIYASISTELNSQVLLTYHSSTRVTRSYELIRVDMTYHSQDGQTRSLVARYRPPVSAVAVDSSVPAGPTVTLPQSIEPPAAIQERPQQNTQQMDWGAAALRPFRWEIWMAALLAAFAVILAGVALAVLLAPSPVSRRVDQYLARSAGADEGIASAGGKHHLTALSAETWGKPLARLSPTKYTELISDLLVLMGPPYRMTLGKFLGMQFALTAIAALLALLVVARSDSTSPAQGMLAFVVAIGAGLYLPYFWLKRKVAQRQKAVLRALPGALDFLAINVEAGMGLDAAIGQVVKRWRNTLTDEFGLLLVDFRIGKDRKEAWKDLIRRTQVPELTTFITAMLQNEQVGISIGALLRTQADQMRVRRRQAAEETARTAPVKMLLPMVFFIFPGIFVIVLGPAIPQLLETFAHVGK